jgi:hypothetical protein
MASSASTRAEDLRNPGTLDPETARRTAPALVAAAAAALTRVLPQGLSARGRLSLIVTVLAVLGWTATRLPDSLVALLAGLALVLGGALPAERPVLLSALVSSAPAGAHPSRSGSIHRGRAGRLSAFSWPPPVRRCIRASRSCCAVSTSTGSSTEPTS